MAEFDLQEIRTFFSHDRYATEACGCEILEAAPGHAVCAFDVTDRHRNALGAVMGGAIFTVADFALAVASNVGQPHAVSVTNTIEYLGGVRGTRVIATCDANKDGRRIGFYTVNVTDELGTPVAHMVATSMRLS